MIFSLGTEKSVGASLLAMVVNDYARFLVERGVLGAIVGSPPGAGSLLQLRIPLFADLLSAG
ncbi:hypothetical protein EMIT0P74_20331 [Pseudomonas sp. IT-P74]